MSFNEIKKIAESLSKMIEDNEKIALPLFVEKLSRASKQYPEDHCIGMMSEITKKMMLNSNKILISRAEIKDLYSKLYSRNTKFAQLFAEELGQVENKNQVKIYDRSDDSADASLDSIYDKVIDPVLLSSLNLAFGVKKEAYSSITAKKAADVCFNSLNSLLISPKEVSIVGGKEDHFILCKASFETPKGLTNVLLPVEMNGKTPLFPSVFIGNEGPVELTEDSIKNYILSNAGSSLKVNEQKVLNALASLEEDTISGVDLAVSKLNAQAETSGSLFDNNVVYNSIPELEQKDLDLPKYEDTEILNFAKHFDSKAGIAEFKFGKQALNKASQILKSALNELGIKDYQMSLSDVGDDDVSFTVKANNVVFTTPVKISGNNVELSPFIVSNGSIETFDKEGLTRLSTSLSFDYKAASSISSLYPLHPGALVDIVEKSMAEGNLKKAEDALNVILAKSSEDTPDKFAYENAYKSAFATYIDCLNQKEKPQNTCNMKVKHAHSTQTICGHTGLPINKVYQDKNGNCVPLYRKNIEDAGSALSMTSKILF